MVKSSSCVAAYRDESGRIYLAADSQAIDSSGTREEIAQPKILLHEGAAVAIVGSLRVAQIMGRLLREQEPQAQGPALMEWLAEALAAELEAAEGVDAETEWLAVVASDSRLFVLQRDFSWYEPTLPFLAEGAGADAAWAVLWLLHLGLLSLPPQEAVRWAIYAAMTRNSRVGGEVHTATL